MPSSVFQRLSPASDPAAASELVALLSEALSQEGMAQYFTRRNSKAAARLWAELLQLMLGAAGGAAEQASSSSSTPLYQLADRSAAAVVLQYPEDRAGWHRGSALLRLAKSVPFRKLRALHEALVAADRQKAAFHASHGPFLHLAAIAVAPQMRGAGLGSVLLDHVCRMADQQRLPLYAEATADEARGWLRRHGFSEQMQHCVRPHAPPIVIMVRWPAPPAGRSTANGAAGRASNGGVAPVQGQQQGQQQQPKPVLRPSGSVRTR